MAITNPVLKRHIISFVISVFVFSITVSCNRFTQDSGHKESYVGTELTAATLLCKSDRLASGGFFRDLKTSTVETVASIHHESKPTTWRITLKGNNAEVIRFSGATETIEETETYTVESTLSGILLISQRIEQGTSPQIITIDKSNSSFVYTSQHVNPFYNRANIFYGSCAPYL